jgi:hypothetical protein
VLGTDREVHLFVALDPLGQRAFGGTLGALPGFRLYAGVASPAWPSR